jgi:hypothetical protein
MNESERKDEFGASFPAPRPWAMSHSDKCAGMGWRDPAGCEAANPTKIRDSFEKVSL